MSFLIPTFLLWVYALIIHFATIVESRYFFNSVVDNFPFKKLSLSTKICIPICR